MAMKQLFLLRHAQTLPGNGLADIERKLTPNGQTDARALGGAMKTRGYQPDFIFCSSARRTQETLGHIMETLEECPTEITPNIYHGGRGDLFHLIQNAGEDIDTILLIGHNPTIHKTAFTLAQEDSPALMGRLSGGYAPGTLSVFECSCATWAEIQAGTNPLIDLLEPLDYNAPATPARWT